MTFFCSPVGRKLVMALSGFILVFFITIHLVGNSSFYVGPDGINAYASKLHSLGPFVWVFRLFMLAAFAIHMYFGISLYLENRAAKTSGYAVTKHLKATVASKTMIWTGLTVAAFLVYHLLHFTIPAISPETSALRNFDIAGRPDVFTMMLKGFKGIAAPALYAIGLVALGLHISHGMQSMLQTVGVAGEKTLPVMIKAAIIGAAVIFIGYIAIPASVLAGIIKG